MSDREGQHQAIPLAVLGDVRRGVLRYLARGGLGDLLAVQVDGSGVGFAQAC